MKQATVNHLVARATGESVQRIRRMGFSIIIPGPAPQARQPRPVNRPARLKTQVA